MWERWVRDDENWPDFKSMKITCSSEAKGFIWDKSPGAKIK